MVGTTLPKVIYVGTHVPVGSSADALTCVSGAVGGAAGSSAGVFVRGFHDKMGLCPICQEGFDLGGYGVLSCSHIMHLDCRNSYEAHERGRAPNRRPECHIFQSMFEGFVCICV